MMNGYLRFLVLFIVLGIIMPRNTYGYNSSQPAGPDTSKVKAKVSAKITDTRVNKPAYLKNGVKVNFIPFKPGKDAFFGNTTIMGSPKPVAVSTEKILNNVKVYPNPISDYLNLTYSINRDVNVTIKIMDVLGNEITTLFAERLTEGEHSNSFSIASRITSGFYFIRVSVGNEIITKRISVL